ncbi:hypothetical protein HSX10_07850 [Winogradskyella undariae]|uniref:hypothetical protein n=1 Tax=Winogradskyella undariae TaxID=1285465 RepID=UPI00156BA911|nr:hypothetical protein [Winogradskyella undariae]NRR91474.1 hypothetical protein [Winogradskyella undariae]
MPLKAIKNNKINGASTSKKDFDNTVFLATISKRNIKTESNITASNGTENRLTKIKEANSVL